MVLDSYLVDEIAVAAFTGDDGLDGVASYASRVVHPCRIEERSKTIRDADGTFIETTTVVATRAIIGPRDRVWFAPLTSFNRPRTFTSDHVFLDADARSPKTRQLARRRRGARGHAEVYF